MRYGSVCSGIEAASVAWHPLGWRASWLAEIEAFPAAVLAHHYPEVPNLGDMTTIARRVMTGEVDAPDVLVGGTPCQAFSVAGLRQSLADARGNLTLKFVELADAVDHVRAARGEQPAIIVWENVPGVLNTPDNAFGCFLGALAGEDCELQPAGKRWSDAGCVYGPARAVAWRILDAQYFGLAQRRRRVFVVASARDGFDPAAVLLEWHGVRRDSAPSREAREGTAGGTGAGIGSRHWPADVASTLNAAFGSKLGLEDQHIGGGRRSSSLATMAHGQDGAEIAQDRAPTLTCNHEAPILFHGGGFDEVAHTLRGEGFDASEDGTGRGTPLVPVAFTCKDYGADAGEIAPTLRSMGHNKSHANAGGQVAIAFNARQDPDRWHDRTGPLDTDGSTQAVSYAIQAVALRTNPASGPDGVGVQADHAYTLEARAEVQAVAVSLRGREGGATAELGDEVGNCLRASGGGGDKAHVLAPVVGPMTACGGTEKKHGFGWGQQDWENGYCQPTPAMQVRRLTPRECERLQGFPDDYSMIPWRGKPADQCPDGPRYKALGNSMAVPVMRWIGRRISDAIHSPGGGA